MEIERVFRESIDLLTRLIKIPSPSGQESEAVAFLEDRLNAFFPQKVTRRDRNLLVDLQGSEPGRTLLLCSHIDTVDALGTWTRDPYGAEQEDDKIYGLGSNDAGASIASMIAAARLIGTPRKGRLLLSLVAEEETGSCGFYTIESGLPRYSAAIFGEPTNMQPATAMRGAMKVLLRSHGVGCHASLPWEGKNAVDSMVRDIQAIRSIDLRDNSPWGGATIEPTIIVGGKSSNQIPALVETTLDIRTTAEKHNDWILSKLKETGVDIEVLFNRRKPMFNPREAEIVEAFYRHYPDEHDCVFNGTCDMAFATAPSIILGPGDLRMAHVADEFTRPSEIKQAIPVYQRVIGSYLGL